MTMTKFEILWEGAQAAEVQVILAHGAGAPMDSPFMNQFAEGLADFGIRVARFEFPYMHQRRLHGSKRPPDRQAILLETWRAILKEFQEGCPLVIGGKSMGGRMASLIADDSPIQGLLCLGYPFHPPRKPEKTRVAHLKMLKTPTLILQGTRDALGNQAEVSQYELSESITIHWLEDGDHSFKPRKASGRTETENLKEGLAMAANFALNLKR